MFDKSRSAQVENRLKFLLHNAEINDKNKLNEYKNKLQSAQLAAG